MTEPNEEASTDGENATLDKADIPEPLWLRYEKDVERHVGLLEKNATVTHDAKITGRVSRTERQVDVLIAVNVLESPMTLAIECKRYAKKIGIGKIDEFAGKLIDLGADKGIIYSFRGFTKPAIARAEASYQPAIQIGDLSPKLPKLPDWNELLPGFDFPDDKTPKFGDCPNENCVNGDVEWTDFPQDSGEIIRGGTCPECGTHAVRCPLCEEISHFFWKEVQCCGCDRSFAQLVGQDGDFEGVIAEG